MSEYKLVLPAMGEGVMEATIVSWLVAEGDRVKEDDSVVEIATDKVDSDVPTPVSGKVVSILKKKDETARVGEVIAIIEMEGAGQVRDTGENKETHKESSAPGHSQDSFGEKEEDAQISISESDAEVITELERPLHLASAKTINLEESESYFSPLVRSMIREEKVTDRELSMIKGSGLNNRITKEDILEFLDRRAHSGSADDDTRASSLEGYSSIVSDEARSEKKEKGFVSSTSASDGDEVIPMDRMRRIIAQNMVRSKQIAPHVTSFIETDVTRIVQWRNKFKNSFQQRTGEKLTYTPIFVKAVVKAIEHFPLVNISVQGEEIIKKKNINIGIATALPDGNLIVPVIKNANQLSLFGLAKALNDIVYRARNKKLKPEDTQGATYTISNIGSFGNLMGTPIIPQPQVAILAIGAIMKKPVVLETDSGDAIAIRSMMFMSHSYDHRVVDGSLGGLFLKYVHDYLQNWDLSKEI
ncbi:MAG: 2-oxo acid dehydrogenase subunit E2 [Bergeyella sp.]|nr:2-oxo acid dehydrogenase subunit E2 [Bergeyella sp.]